MSGRVLAIGGIWCALWACAAGGEAPKYDAMWRLVARAHYIVVGQMSVPIDKFRAAKTSGKDTYVTFNVSVEECIKGNYGAPSLAIRHFTADRPYLPSPDAIVALDGKRAVFFVTQSDEPGSKGCYLLSGTRKSCQECTPELVEEVRTETRRQDAILKGYPNWLAPEQKGMGEKVKGLINDAVKRPAHAQEAVNQLIALGPGAVPSLVRHMEDFRPLKTKLIAFPNRSPEAFEMFAQYGPDAVVDLVSTVATLVAGESFGQIYNGGSERERRAVINAWRVYLYDAQKPGS